MVTLKKEKFVKKKVNLSETKGEVGNMEDGEIERGMTFMREALLAREGLEQVEGVSGKAVLEAVVP